MVRLRRSDSLRTIAIKRSCSPVSTMSPRSTWIEPLMEARGSGSHGRWPRPCGRQPPGARSD